MDSKEECDIKIKYFEKKETRLVQKHTQIPKVKLAELEDLKITDFAEFCYRKLNILEYKIRTWKCGNITFPSRFSEGKCTLKEALEEDPETHKWLVFEIPELVEKERPQIWTQSVQYDIGKTLRPRFREVTITVITSTTSYYNLEGEKIHTTRTSQIHLPKDSKRVTSSGGGMQDLMTNERPSIVPGFKNLRESPTHPKLFAIFKFFNIDGKDRTFGNRHRNYLMQGDLLRYGKNLKEILEHIVQRRDLATDGLYMQLLDLDLALETKLLSGDRFNERTGYNDEEGKFQIDEEQLQRFLTRKEKEEKNLTFVLRDLLEKKNDIFGGLQVPQDNNNQQVIEWLVSLGYNRLRLIKFELRRELKNEPKLEELMDKILTKVLAYNKIPVARTNLPLDASEKILAFLNGTCCQCKHFNISK